MENLDDKTFEQYWKSLLPITRSRFRYFGINPRDEDAVQLARIALVRALRDYDPSRGSLVTHYFNEFNSYVPTEYYSKYKNDICYPTWLVKTNQTRRKRTLRTVRTISLYHQASEYNSPIYESFVDRSMDIPDLETVVAMQQMLDLLARRIPAEYVNLFKMLSGFSYDRPYNLKEIASLLGLRYREAVNLYKRACQAIHKAIREDEDLQQCFMDVLYRVDSPHTYLHPDKSQNQF